MAFSLDLRERVISYIQAGHNQSDTSKTFNLGIGTILNWIKLYQETGSLSPRPHGGGFQSKVDAEEFKKYVENYPDQTLHEMGEHFGISHEGVAYNLRKHGFVHKKNSSVLRKKRRKTKRLST